MPFAMVIVQFLFSFLFFSFMITVQSTLITFRDLERYQIQWRYVIKSVNTPHACTCHLPIALFSFSLFFFCYSRTWFQLFFIPFESANLSLRNRWGYLYVFNVIIIVMLRVLHFISTSRRENFLLRAFISWLRTNIDNSCRSNNSISKCLYWK